MAQQKSVMIYLDTESVLEPLSLEEVGTVFLSIFEYFRTREIPSNLSVGAQVAFRSIKNHLDRDIDNYEAKCKLNSEKGKKGGRPRKTLPQTEEKSCGFFEKAEKANNNSNNNNNNNNNTSEEEQSSETPPPASPPPLPEKELEELGIPLDYAEERIERAEHFARSQRKSVVEVLSDWWQTDKAGTPPNNAGKSFRQQAPPSADKSYDIDDFIEAALRRSEAEAEEEIRYFQSKGT